MVKKSDKGANRGLKDTSAEFFKKMKSKATVLKKAGKEKAPTGYTTKEEQIEAFNLRVGGKATTTARCTGGRVGLDKNKNMFASFNFVCTGSIGAGQTPSKYIGLYEQGNRTEEQAFKDLAFTLQNLGYDTDDLSESTIKSILTSIKEDQPLVSITLSRYAAEGLDVRVNRPLEESEEEDSESEDDDESEEEDEEEDSDEDESDNDDDSDEDDAEEDSEHDDSEDDDPNSWVGSKATVKTSKMPKAGKVTLLSYNEKTKTFNAKNSKGEAVKVKLDEVQEVH